MSRSRRATTRGTPELRLWPGEDAHELAEQLADRAVVQRFGAEAERPALLGIALEVDVGVKRHQHQRADGERDRVKACRVGRDAERASDKRVILVGEVKQRGP